MRTLIHPENLQACVATAALDGGRPKNFPLQIRPEPEGLAQIPEDFKKELIVGLLPKLDWEGLRETAADLGVAALPESMPEDAAENEAFLRSVHALVMEIHVKQAALVCKNCGRVYPVVKSVPNLMLTEDEV